MTEQDSILAVGTAFGAYRIVRLMGRGGMGAVYEAEHSGLHKRVALKTLHAHFAYNADAAARFVREGKSAARIRHPHVVDVTDVGAENGTPYLVMEYLDGEDLEQRLRRDGPLDVPVVCDVMLPVLAAISAAHAAGVIHRDLKPANIFLCPSVTGGTHPKVLDFGISKVAPASDERPNDRPALTNTGAVLGTAYYMSPEQARGAKQIDPRSDIYSLGAILYEAACGQRAHVGDSMLEVLANIVAGSVTPLSTLRPTLDPRFIAVVETAMRRVPDERFRNANEMAAALVPLAGERTRLTWGELFVPSSPPPALAAPANSAPTDAGIGLHTTLGSSARSMTFVDTQRRRASSRRGAIGAVAATALVVAAALGWSRWTPKHAPATNVATSTAVRSSLSVAQLAPLEAHVVNLPPAVEAPPQHFTMAVAVTPANATLELDGTVIAHGAIVRELAADGSDHALRVSSSGYEPQTVRFRDAPPPTQIELHALAAPTRPPPTSQIRATTPRTTTNGSIIVR